MNTVVLSTNVTHKPLLRVASGRYVRKRFKNVEAFEAWAFQQEGAYEFANKRVIRKEMIKDVELMIIWWLNKYFKLTKSFQEDALLISEVGMRLSEDNFRVPDVSYFTAEQHFATAQGEHPVAELVMEFLSKNETAEQVADKINDYFAAGVKLVWYIYPKTETIYVYSSPKDIKVCAGDDVVSAAPVVPDFQFPAQGIFRKEMATEEFNTETQRHRDGEKKGGAME
jgi:Uma2 family endonuclease